MELYTVIASWLNKTGISPDLAGIASLTATSLLIVIIAWVAFKATNRYLVKFLDMVSRRSKNIWDDTLIAKGFARRFSSMMPIVIIYMAADIMLPADTFVTRLILRLTMALLIITGVRVIDSFLLAARDIYGSTERSGGRPIRGYTDAAKIITYLLAAILVLSILTDKSPWGILSVLGGFTVILLLVFKDTILGFVASIQLTGLDMVRVGDWIEMPKYGADGDVIDVSIHTVKVRNWDKTISTIPTYSLVSDAFKNWRGMSESGGRRIKRSLVVDMNSIKFCTDAMLERFSRYELLKNYLAGKKQEIKEYNREKNIDTTELINGRRQTNIGVFRAYVLAYLRSHPKIHQDMTFLVRHLEPTPQGLPVQIYVFSNDQAWANYEAIQADIFDHLLAALPEFELRIFQTPTGHDISAGLSDFKKQEVRD